MLGPLATYAEPHCYDLCKEHAARLTVPLGWEVVRLNLSGQPRTPGRDDLSALVDAVREAAEASDAEAPKRAGKNALEPPAENPGTRRSHLRVLRDEV